MCASAMGPLLFFPFRVQMVLVGRGRIFPSTEVHLKCCIMVVVSSIGPTRGSFIGVSSRSFWMGCLPSALTMIAHCKDHRIF